MHMPIETTSQNISLDKAYEVRHWSRMLDLNQADLYTAVRHVGKNLAALRAYRASISWGLPCAEPMPPWRVH